MSGPEHLEEETDFRPVTRISDATGERGAITTGLNETIAAIEGSIKADSATTGDPDTDVRFVTHINQGSK